MQASSTLGSFTCERIPSALPLLRFERHEPPIASLLWTEGVLAGATTAPWTGREMECRGCEGVRRKDEEGTTMEAMIAAARAVSAMAERLWGASSMAVWNFFRTSPVKWLK